MDKTEAYDAMLNALKKIVMQSCRCNEGECSHEIAGNVLNELGWTFHSIHIPIEEDQE